VNLYLRFGSSYTATDPRLTQRYPLLNGALHIADAVAGIIQNPRTDAESRFWDPHMEDIISGTEWRNAL